MMKRTHAAIFATALLLAPASAVAQTAKPSGNFVTVQPADQWLATQFLGQAVTNAAGESIGDINDLLFDKTGRIANVVIGVGGFLGIGEKNVAIPYNTLQITADANGKRVVKVELSRERLNSAPDFKATEKTVYMRAKEQAGDIGQRAMDKAGELKDRAAKKIEEMRREDAK
jgi:sporulation protein YlmC with PRC-barrel domain